MNWGVGHRSHYPLREKFNKLYGDRLRVYHSPEILSEFIIGSILINSDTLSLMLTTFLFSFDAKLQQYICASYRVPSSGSREVYPFPRFCKNKQKQMVSGDSHLNFVPVNPPATTSFDPCLQNFLYFSPGCATEVIIRSALLRNSWLVTSHPVQLNCFLSRERGD